jgi:uncharacterized protein YoxC
MAEDSKSNQGEKLSDSEKLAIQSYVESLVEKWLKRLGLLNLVAILGAFAYIFFVIPDQAASKVFDTYRTQVETIQESITRITSTVNELQVNVPNLQNQVLSETTKLETITKDTQQLSNNISILGQDGAIDKAANFIQAVDGAQNLNDFATGLETQIKALETQVATLQTQLNLGTNFIISNSGGCPAGWDSLGTIGIIAETARVEQIKPHINVGGPYGTGEWRFIHPVLCKKI